MHQNVKLNSGSHKIGHWLKFDLKLVFMLFVLPQPTQDFKREKRKSIFLKHHDELLNQ